MKIIYFANQERKSNLSNIIANIIDKYKLKVVSNDNYTAYPIVILDVSYENLEESISVLKEIEDIKKGCNINVRVLSIIDTAEIKNDDISTVALLSDYIIKNGIDNHYLVNSIIMNQNVLELQKSVSNINKELVDIRENIGYASERYDTNILGLKMQLEYYSQIVVENLKILNFQSLDDQKSINIAIEIHRLLLLYKINYSGVDIGCITGNMKVKVHYTYFLYALEDIVIFLHRIMGIASFDLWEMLEDNYVITTISINCKDIKSDALMKESFTFSRRVMIINGGNLLIQEQKDHYNITIIMPYSRIS